MIVKLFGNAHMPTISNCEKQLAAILYMSRGIRFPTMWNVRPAKGSDQPAHTRSLIRAFASCLNIL